MMLNEQWERLKESNKKVENGTMRRRAPTMMGCHSYDILGNPQYFGHF